MIYNFFFFFPYEVLKYKLGIVLFLNFIHKHVNLLGQMLIEEEKNKKIEE